MPEVKFTHVVSFSSEDPVFKAENLLNSTSKIIKWRSLNEGEPQLVAVLQMEKPAQIQSIDIGNDGSAFVEVQVGRRASSSTGDDFHVLLCAASFLTPIESRSGQNLSRVRMFNVEKFNADVSKQQWDQIKVVCTQPFNKHVKYGLSFIKVHSVDLKESPKKKLGAFTLKDEDEDSVLIPVTVGGLFASRVRKPDPPSMSVAASLRSDSTLASIVLSQEEASRKRKLLRDEQESSAKRPPSSSQQESSFYQLKKEKRRKMSNDDEALPRRDVLPGEDQRKRSKETDKKDNKRKDDSRLKKNQVKSEIPVVLATMPFGKLLDGVFFVLSGFQNPLRGQIRDMGIQMGARYRSDWDRSCTHLVCAFPNTPKFREVQRCGGKIVKKDWIEVCHRERKRIPWRRLCLDPADKDQRESEDELWADDLLPSTSGSRDEAPVIDLSEGIKEENGDDPYELDTDEEIEKVNRENAATEKSISVEDLDSDEAYGAETDVDEEEKLEDRHENSPDASSESTLNSVIFRRKVFVFYGPFDNDERMNLSRKIQNSGGSVENFIRESKTDFVVSRETWNRNFDLALEKCDQVRIVRPEFISECSRERRLVDPSLFEIHQ